MCESLNDIYRIFPLLHIFFSFGDFHKIDISFAFDLVQPYLHNLERGGIHAMGKGIAVCLWLSGSSVVYKLVCWLVVISEHPVCG